MSEPENKDTISVLANSKVSKYNSFFKAAGVILLSVVMALGATWGIATLGAGPFAHYQEPSVAEKKAELVGLLSNGNFDSNLLLAEMTESDLSAVGEYVRPVTVNAIRNFSRQEVLDFYKSNFPDKFKIFEDLPESLKEAFGDNDKFSVPITNAIVNGFLTNDKVVVPSEVFVTIFSVPANAGENVQVEIKLLADPSTEDGWKEETLFNGNAFELVDTLDTYVEVGVSFISRSKNKVLVESNGTPYEAALIKEVKPSSVVVYGNSAITYVARVSQVIEGRNLLVVKGSFGIQDYGMPVFVLRDGNLTWAGVIVSLKDNSTAIVASAETIQNRIEQK